MIGVDGMTVRLRAVDLVLPLGLTVSAVLVAVVGGWPGVVVGGAQLIAAVSLLVRPAQPGVLAVTVLILALTPLAAIRTWSAGSPVGCSCFGAPAHPPGVLSLTGLVVVMNLALGGLATWSARSRTAPGPDRTSE